MPTYTSVMSPSDVTFIEVQAARLEPGMFVAQLDRPWLETPFALQGFYVRSAEDVASVAQICSYVYVDPRRRKVIPPPRARRAGRTRAYDDQVELTEEFKTARTEFESASVAMEKVFGRLRQQQHLNLGGVQRAIDPLIGSVLRNSQALAALVRIRSRGDYLYHHALCNAVWAALLGRHLALDPTTLQHLALGVAVMDVGMALLDDRIVRSADKLDNVDRLKMREHVLQSLELLRGSGEEVPADVIQIVANHHERHNGSGYPRGIAGDEIPLLARIAGLVDSYDAMITSRPWAEGRSSFAAMQELVDVQNELFQIELVEQFMQTIGMFPTGSVVELNTGEVGVVVQQNRTRRLRPKIVLILDAEKQRRADLVVIDLASYVHDDVGRADLWIKRELNQGEHGINAEEFFL